MQSLGVESTSMIKLNISAIDAIKRSVFQEVDEFMKKANKNQRRCRKCGKTISETDFRQFGNSCFDCHANLEFCKAFQ